MTAIDQIEAAGLPANPDPISYSPLRRVFRRLATIFENDTLDRLTANIAPYRVELEQIRESWVEHSGAFETGESPAWYKRCLELLELAETAGRNREADKAWEAFHAAKRIELHAYQIDCATPEKSQAALQARAAALLFESQSKLDGWRLKTVENRLANENKGLRERFDLEDVLTANRILTDAYANIYRRLRLTRRQFFLLITIGVGAFGAWLLLIDRPGFSLEGPVESGPDWFWTVVMFGVMGACTSGLISLGTASLLDRLPEKLLSSWVTLARPVVGGLSAIALVLFAVSGVLSIEGVDVNAPELVLVLAFAGGFSERLLTTALQRL